MNITLTGEQKNVIKEFMKFLIKPDEKYLIIRGAAGCGKTTMIKYMLASIQKEYKLLKTLMCKKADDDFNILLTATTNKAVAVLQELSGDSDVKTVHSTIGIRLTTNFSNGKQYLIKTDRFVKMANTILILDEASMLNWETFKFIDEALLPGSKLILIGDEYQLAPVKEKKVMMQDIIGPVASLHKVLRHAGTILETATIFRDVVKTQEFQDIPLSDAVIQADGPTFKDLVEAAFLDPNYNGNSAKILAWSNDRVQEYNHHIRKAKGMSRHLQAGEIVITNNPIMTKNRLIPVDSEVTITQAGETIEKFGISGCMVTINRLTPAFLPYDYKQAKNLSKMIAKKAKSIEMMNNHTERSKLWTLYYEIKESWLDLRAAYASTVHKSQGSSYDTVFIDLSDIGRCNIQSDVARMLYVAISRAKTQVVLYGNLPAKYRGKMAA